MYDKFNLDGKIALINGGAGGLGSGLSLGISQAGATVVIADVLPMEELEKKAAEIKAATGNDTMALNVDVTNEESMQKVVDAVVEKYGAIDICINAFGLNRKSPALDYPMEQWDAMFAVNVKGIMIACKTVGKVMTEKGNGAIVNLSSVREVRGYTGGNSAYCATKGAVGMLTKTLAIEYASKNVRVNAIGPSLVITQGTAHIKDNPELADKYKKEIPLGRLGEPEDLVGAAIYLSSDASSFVTGLTIFVDGGLLA
jgi:NAD(P)-dependent dehydrogenase (short-subunit alcohol dehydrogenase family)